MGSSHIQPSRLSTTVHQNSVPVSHPDFHLPWHGRTHNSFSARTGHSRHSRHRVSQGRKAQDVKELRPTIRRKCSLADPAELNARKKGHEEAWTDGENSFGRKTSGLFDATKTKSRFDSYVSS